MLMVGKVLESLQRVGSGKIKAASRAEEAGVATLARLYTDVGPMTGVRGSSRKVSPFKGIVRLRG